MGRNLLTAAGQALTRIFQANPGPLAIPRITSVVNASNSGGGLASSTTYWYKVTAGNGSGEGLPSQEYSYWQGASGTNLNQFTVSVLVYPGTTTVKVYRATTSGSELLVGSTTGITFSAAELIAGSKTVTFTDPGTTPSGALPSTDASGAAVETSVYGPVSASTSVRLDEVTISNRGPIAATCGVSVIPSGASLDGTHWVVPPSFTVQPGDTRVITLHQGLDTGDQIAVAASTNLVTATGSGLVTT